MTTNTNPTPKQQKRRVCVTISEDIHKAAQARVQQIPGVRSFSGFVEMLVARDVEERKERAA